MSQRKSEAVRIRRPVRALKAYHVPPAEAVIKLNAMENPYGWPSALSAEWSRCLAEISLNRYPDPQAHRVKDALRSVFEIPLEYALLLGNGSDELIQLLIMTMADDDCVVLTPSPTFVMYEHSSIALRTHYVSVDLTQDFELDVDAFLEAMERHNPAIVFLAYPNNPTGNLFDRRSVETIIEHARGLVVVDEAYEAFARQSYLPQLGRYENLVVMRTLSKAGFAGIRLGYLVGPAGWLGEFEKLRLPYNINVLTQATAEFALAHYETFRDQTNRISQNRGALMQSLSTLRGVQPFGSQTNFILFRVSHDAQAIFSGLLDRGVLIKNFDGTHPLLERCLRVTVGTTEENAHFVDSLRETLIDL